MGESIFAVDIKLYTPTKSTITGGGIYICLIVKSLAIKEV